MKLKIVMCFLIGFYFNSVSSQIDTVTQNQITIKKNNQSFTYWRLNKKYSGIIKVKTEDNFCYQEILNGILVRDDCKKIINNQNNVIWSEIAKNYNPDSIPRINEFVCISLDVKYNGQSSDSTKIQEKILTLKERYYDGFIRKNDTLIFYYHGVKRFVNTFHSNSLIHEYIETKNLYKNGLYIKYNSNGEIIHQGNYSMNKKTGEWIELIDDNTLCINNYVFGEFNGLNHCYNGDKLVLIQKFSYGNLIYYCKIEYREGKVFYIKFDNKDKPLSSTIYFNNQLIEYVEY
jgi:antitoxin component YwqK of YwqJK toxin-antitoxin module